MSEVAESTRKKIYQAVLADLKPSRLVVHGKLAASVGLGGLLSLFLCGQLGFGLSDLAETVHHSLMGVMGFFGCTAVCGVLFAIVPVVTLRLLCSPMQFQTIARREWKASAGWILAFGGVLSFVNSRSDGLWVLFLWGVAAVASFEVLSRGLHWAFSLRMSRETF